MATALERLFPGHHFYCLPAQEEIASNPDLFPLRGFTSTPLTEQAEQRAPESARELVERAAQAVIGTRGQAPADLALILDDLELANAQQPERVVRVMRRAVLDHLSELERRSSMKTTRQTAERLRNQVSFHIVSPMLEGWFFGDPQALARAGVPDPRAAVFDSEQDPEYFCTEDPAYREATEADCPVWTARQRKRKNRPKWLGDGERARHPKGYLQWLCRDPEDPSCTRYSEKEGGAPALASLRWETLFARSPDHFPFLRAMVEDLARDLGDSACGRLIGTASPHTSCARYLPDPVLRNL